jgi:hypothetical protein
MEQRGRNTLLEESTTIELTCAAKEVEAIVSSNTLRKFT